MIVDGEELFTTQNNNGQEIRNEQTLAADPAKMFICSCVACLLLVVHG